SHMMTAFHAPISAAAFVMTILSLASVGFSPLRLFQTVTEISLISFRCAQQVAYWQFLLCLLPKGVRPFSRDGSCRSNSQSSSRNQSTLGTKSSRSIDYPVHPGVANAHCDRYE